jgi:hypothetical protein
MPPNHHDLLRSLRDEFQEASQKYGAFFHAILKFPPVPEPERRKQKSAAEVERIWRPYREALHALAVGLLAPDTWGGVAESGERLLVADAQNGESECALTACSATAALFMKKLTTRAFRSLPADLTVKEPLHSFADKPRFCADHYTEWMLFVYRRLAGSGSLVVRRPATKLEFNHTAVSFPLEELDPCVLVTYLSVDAWKASVNAIDVELNRRLRAAAGPEPAPASAAPAPPSATPAPPAAAVRADSGADSGEETENDLPENPNVLKLALRVKRRRHGTSMIDVARAYVVEELDEEDQEDRLAQSLLRQVRRYPHLYR